MIGGRPRRAPALRAVLVAVALAWPAAAAAAPKAELWDRWLAEDPASPITVDHSAWDALLARFETPGADGVLRFDYARAGAEDRAALAAYLDSLAAVPIPACRRDEQRAFWINLYNALTVKVVLDHYPVDSIMDIDISPGLFTQGPWGRKLIAVDGEELSLDDIEHRILRPIWRDARLHYALNCASVGCPELANVAYTAANTEEMLDAGARAYINNPRGVTVGPRGLTLSKIYSWYEDDFGGEAGVLAHIARYAAPALAAELAKAPAIRDYQYDWRLNDAE